MSYIEHVLEKVGVEAYVLKKITKDVPLNPIPVALKWGHLSDLKLEDSDFRIPARIDLLLGTEVLMSILCDSRRIEPQDTPSTINTFFGRVLFGIIQGNDVVDLANLTIEQDVISKMMGTIWSYSGMRLYSLPIRTGTPTTVEETRC